MSLFFLKIITSTNKATSDATTNAYEKFVKPNNIPIPNNSLISPKPKISIFLILYTIITIINNNNTSPFEAGGRWQVFLPRRRIQEEGNVKHIFMK